MPKVRTKSLIEARSGGPGRLIDSLYRPFRRRARGDYLAPRGMPASHFPPGVRGDMTDGLRDITTLLHAHAAGENDALDELLPRVYEELRRIARVRLRQERADHTLSATEVVHEAFLKLIPLESMRFEHRAHFYGIASRAMRNVLVDHAVRRKAGKRGGGAVAITLDDAAARIERPLDELIALGHALDRLEQLDPRQARVVECRFFGGLNLEETAAALGISAATVSRDWTIARAWLNRELAGAPSAG
jgi:RNA polymerase sigma factor (TIGR02999 family)